MYKTSVIICLLLATLYLLVAYKSSGYHHEDEHYQIIEFANYKLGLLPANRLAWEFNSEIRPGLQPFLCYVLLGIARFLGITDGFTLAFLLRAFAAILSLLVVKKFTAVFARDLEPGYRKYFTAASYLLWFLPYIYVRFSSETLSGLMLMLATATLHGKDENRLSGNLIYSGILLGLAILFRYQSALAVAGIIIWLLLIRKSNFAAIIKTSLAIAAVLGMGVVFDYWLYGKFTVTLYNYFWVNIVQGVSSSFGVSPWYEYLLQILTAPGPFGIIIWISLIYLICFQWKYILLWTILPFLIVHSIIPHKELRFLFPLAGFVTITCSICIQGVSEHLRNRFVPFAKFKPFALGLLFVLCLSNIAGLIAVATSGAGTKRIPVAEFIHRNYRLSDTRIIVSGDINPYMDWGPPKNSYYSSSGLDIVWDNIWDNKFMGKLDAEKTNLLVILEEDAIGPKTSARLKKDGFKKVYQNIPDLVKLIYRIYDPDKLGGSMEVYQYMGAFNRPDT